MSKNKQGADNALNDIKKNLGKKGVEINTPHVPNNNGGIASRIKTANEGLQGAAVELTAKLETPKLPAISEQLKRALDEITGATISHEEANTAIQILAHKPLISIVTIFNDENAKKYLQLYMKGLPSLALDENGNALIEVVLCKTIRDDSIENNGTLEKPETTMLNGKTVRHAEYIYKGDFNFADARNAAKHWATGEWILSLDTDESLIPQQFQDLVELIGSMPKFVGGVKFTVLSHIPIITNGMVEYHREHVNTVRLFRNDVNIQWQSRVHETPSFSIQDNGYMINDSTITIFHTGYEVNKEALIGKLERNLKGIEIEYATATHKAVKEHNRVYMISTVLEIEKLRSQ